MVLRRWQSANRIMDAVVLLGMRRAKPCRRLDSVVFGVSINRFLAATAIRAAGAGGSTPTEEGGGITRTTISEEPLDFVLPPPSWSLTDLNLARRQDTPAEDNTSSAVLTREEVAKLCALAHIDLAPDESEGGKDAKGGGEGGLDAAAVQRDVGAMLRCMQTMTRGQDQAQAAHGTMGEEETEQAMGDGPWGGAAAWAAPLQEDIVSDGGIQDHILGAAQRTNDGFYTAPRVVGGDEGVP